MKNLCLLASIILVLAGCQGQTADPVTASEMTVLEDTQFDAALAETLGADDYGMRSYVFATLKTGPRDAEITDENERAELFKGHFAMINRLAESGDLVLAGPFVEASPKRGLYIFNVKTIEEAKELVKSDPSIAAGIFEVEFDKYYGSAALMQVNDIHARIQKTKVN